MFRNSETEIPYNDIDHEIRELVRNINKIDGIETIESCFGHNENPCVIYCKAETIEALTFFIFNFFDNEKLWKLNLTLDDIHKNQKDVHFDINSGEIMRYPKVNLMIDNLTYRFERRLTDLKAESEDEE